MKEKQKKLRIVIIILSILLLISLAALAVTVVQHSKESTEATSVTIEDNKITPEAEEEEQEDEEDSFAERQEEEQETSEQKSAHKKSSANKDQTAASGTEQTQGNTVTLTLKKNHPEEGVPFYAENLFPGDSITKNYRVEVTFKKALTVHFEAKVQEGYEKLAEALNCRIVLKRGKGDKLLYDGPMKDLPKESFDQTVYSSSEQHSLKILKYEITAYLDTSVGNEYQNQELKADFCWWVEGEDVKNLASSTGTVTSDPAETVRWIALMTGTFVGIVLLRKRYKKEDGYHG